jgi:hypothetical protein
MEPNETKIFFYQVNRCPECDSSGGDPEAAEEKGRFF